MSDHAVLVHLNLSDDEFGTPEEREDIRSLCDALEAAIEAKEVGEFDGDLWGEGECVLYMYGPDANALFAAVEPVLGTSEVSSGGYAIRRFGESSDPHAKEVRVDL